MLHYILQVIFFQLCFLLIYELLLKKETFFNYNRWYLLATPLLALLLPLLKIHSLAEAVPPQTRLMLPEVFLGDQPYLINLPAVNIAAEAGTSISWGMLIYLGGALISLILFGLKYRSLQRLFRFRKLSEEKEFRIIEVPESNMACTFFSTIFLGSRLSGNEKQQILSHELVHVKQRHSLDLLYFEIFKVLFWFNPLVYLYQHRIAALHEFIADADVVKTTGKKSYYQQLLNTAFNTQNISFINQFFNHSLIKKRIIMLQKSRSKAILKFKYLILVPLMLVMLTYVACSENNSESSEQGSDLSQYSYTLQKGEEMTSEQEATHKKYEAFLKGHPDYVSWATINHNTNEVSYSVHPKGDAVPDGYRQLAVDFPDGGSYVMYMNLKSSSASNKSSEDDEIPFALVDEVPVFPGCESLDSNKERKECTTDKISHFINAHFNTEVGKQAGLKGVFRIVVKFRIDETGKIVDVKSRAKNEQLMAEAERVVKSLPDMKPAVQNGEKVSVQYSLPIVVNYAQ